MRNWIFYLLVVIFIGLIIFTIPFIDGYLFKKVYYQQISMLQSELDNENYPDKIKIEIESYKLGWLKSTAFLKVSYQAPTQFSGPPVPSPNVSDVARAIKLPNQMSTIMSIKSVIHHGPLTTFNSKLQLAYAWVESFIYVADGSKNLSAENKNGFMQVNSKVSLNGKTWTNYYTVTPKSFGQFGNWDGLTGVIVVDTINNEIEKIVNTITIGKISIPSFMPAMPTVTIQPIKSDTEGTRVTKYFWNGKANISIPLVTANWEEGDSFNMNNLISNFTYGVRDKLYHYTKQTTIASIHFPATFPIRDLTKILATLSINNLNPYIKENGRESLASLNDAYKLLTPNTNVAISIDMNSEAGRASAKINLSLLALPKSVNEFRANRDVNADFDIRMAQTFVEKILTAYFTHVSENPASDPAKQAHIFLGMMLERGYIQMDKNNYTLQFNFKGPTIILNGKTISENELQMIPDNIQQDLQKVVVPTSAPAPVPPGPQPQRGAAPGPVIPAAVIDTKGYHCYWMNSSTGRNIWVLMPYYDKQTCYTMDSCSGGLKKSAGGCYKWATSMDAQPEPWNMSTP